jgi:hypothetical protein
MSRSALFGGRPFGGRQFVGRLFAGQRLATIQIKPVVPGGGHKRSSPYASPDDEAQHFIGRQNDLVIALVMAAITRGIIT